MGDIKVPTDHAAVDDRPTSIVFDHCKAVYEEMEEQSRTEVISPSDHEDDPGNHMLVYEGHLTKLFAQLALSTPYYTTVMNHLKAMGCVEQLQRGGGNSPSRWRLLRRPDEDAFRSVEGMNRSRTGKTAALEQQVRDLTKQVNDLRAQLAQLTGHHNDLRHVVDKVAVQAEKLGRHSHAIQSMPGEAPVLLKEVQYV